MGVQERGFIMDGVRTIFSFLDRLIYGLIKWILFGIFDLANLTTNSDVFSGIYSRIYVILGIFMAFKLSFAFFQYIIDPESMTGKGDKTLTKLFSRVFIMLAALIFLPTILFGSNGGEGLLSKAQRAFLPSLPKVIFGVNDIGGLSSNSSTQFTDSIEQSAEEISIATLSGFYYPPEELDDVCGAGTYEKTPKIETMQDFINTIHADCSKGVSVNVLGANIIGTKFYKYSYMWFVSTVVGLLIALLLLGITIDIAKRIFKLMILEVIAPVPIMSLIDPKASKDGAFGKWVKSLTTTFLDIFLKLGLIYLIIVLIHMIVNSGKNGGLFANFPQDAGFRGTYLTILLIIGLIFFAKEAPKFIKDSLGFKGEGGGLFDDVKSVGKAAGLVVGGAGVVGSAIASGRASYMADEENGRDHHIGNVFKNIGAGLVGGISGAGTAVKAATGKDGGIGAVLKAQAQRNASALERGTSGSTWLGRRGSEVSSVFTGDTAAARLGREISSMESEQALIKSIKDRAASEMVKSDKTKGTFGSITGTYNYKKVKAAYDAASASGATSFQIKDEDTGAVKVISTEEAGFNIGALLKSNEEDYIKYAGVDGDGGRLKVDVKLQQLQDEAERQKVKANVRDRGSLGDRSDDIDVAKYQKKREQSRAQANDRYSAKK